MIPAFAFMVSGIFLNSNCQATKSRRRAQETPQTPPEPTPSTSTAISTGTGPDIGGDHESISWETINRRQWEREVKKTANATEIEQWAKNLGTNGKWTDINYDPNKIQFYPPDSHLERVRAMAWAFVSPGSSLKDKSDLKDKIFAALRILDEFKSPTATTQDFSWDYWFSNYVSGPKIILQIMVLLQKEISGDQRLHYLSKMPDQIDATFKDGQSVFAESGQNKVWIADNTFVRESLLRNSDLVKKALKSMASTFTIVSKNLGEGIKSDYSFHQHGAQIYSGGYGYWFVLNVAETMGIIKNTKLEEVFSQSELDVFKNYVLQGFQWHFFKNSFDFGVVGRNITRVGGLSTLALKNNIADLAELYPGDKLAFDSIKNHLDGKPSNLNGNRFFFHSDFMVQRGRDFYLSARVPSTRTDGTESINGENLKGYFLPFGATNILTRGSEYQTMIPVWNWSRIPGVTSEMDYIPELSGYLRGKSQFAGGVSDGLKGLLSFQTSDLGIQSLKSYFFYENVMICLGAGISGTKTKSILTIDLRT